MKRSFMMMLISMLLAISLTACGRDDHAQTSDNPPTTNQEANTNSQTNSGNQEDALMSGSSQNEESSAQNGISGENDTLFDTTTKDPADPEGGVSYEQMLRNGRVHDTDGFLNDGENSVSNIAGDVKNAAGDVIRSARNAVDGLMH